MTKDKLSNIGGYFAIPIEGVASVGLIPRATGVVYFTRHNNTQQTLNGTIGIPQTRGSTSESNNITPPGDTMWCLPQKISSQTKFYSATGPRTATLSGSWVLVADGAQKKGQGILLPVYFGCYSQNGSGDKSIAILPSNINIRISTLDSSVITPTAINFGYASRSTAGGAELALMTKQLIATCGKGSDRINANINLQFRAISGL